MTEAETATASPQAFKVERRTIEFIPESERYGRPRSLFFIWFGVVVEIPFMSTTFYTGPMVAHLGGADIAWIVGLIVTSVTYFILGRSLPAPPEHVTAFATDQGVTS